jgi:beta-fructofuranosidase/levanase/fructan beta-fructosidase
MKQSFILLLLCAFFLSCQQEQKEPVISTENTDKVTEQHRPKFHFTPPAKWMNDPNGMVFYDGEYHLFYQHYPDSTVWGPMHWGHAVSTDLVNWEHLPIALYPDSLGLIFSGSAVIDWKNTSGLGKNGQPPMIAIYTYHHMEKEKAGDIDFQYQGMAYSNDKGRTWKKYDKNPIIPNPGIRDFRDPKVIWDEDSQQWVMVFAAWDHVKFYGSADLKNWNHLSDFGKNSGTHSGVWECPDLFPMTIEGTREKKWVLLQSLNPGSYNGGSGTQYFVGHFDGKNFTVDADFAKALGTIPANIPEGKVFADFENGHGDWIAAGDAFGEKPTNKRMAKEKEITGFTQNSLVSSRQYGDKMTGKLTSQKFKIEQDFINFQIGGGNDKLRTCVNLVIDGKTVRNAAGSNNKHLKWTSWDVADLQGKTAHIEVIDTHPGGWGHINLDQITFADSKAQPEQEKAVWLDYGRDNYAGVTWADVPAEDGRRIFMGWMSNWDYAQVVPTQKWRSAMTLARTLTLKNTSEGLRLITQPVEELKQLRGKSYKTNGELKGKRNLTKELKLHGNIFEIMVEMEILEDSKPNLNIQFSNDKNEHYSVGFNATTNEFYSDRTQSGKTDFSAVFAQKIHTAPRSSNSELVKMHLFLDVASAELFADDGQVALTDIFFPTEDFSTLSINVENGMVNLKEIEIFELKETSE